MNNTTTKEPIPERPRRGSDGWPEIIIWLAALAELVDLVARWVG